MIIRHEQQLLAIGWKAEKIAAIDEDHRALVNAYQSEPVFADNISECGARKDIKESWVPERGLFERLCNFLRKICNSFPKTGPLESDFTFMGWQKDECRQSLTDSSREEILHAKQIKRIGASQT